MSTFDPVKYKEIEREVYSRTAKNYAKYCSGLGRAH
jgi:hypothetical protein